MRERYELLIQGVKNGTLDLTKPSVYRRFLILKQVKELRTGLSKAVSSEVTKELELGQHNIAYGSYKITLPNGKIISGDFISVSGKNVSKIIIDQIGTSFNKKNIIPEVNRVNKKLGRFKVTRKGGDHDFDRKLFEYLLKEMEKSLGTPLKVDADYQGRGFSRKIVVNSEMTPCYSCEEIIGLQFQEMFGKDIQVDVHGGVDYQ
ncbi:hypothetical protein [Nostoc sp.]